MLDDLRSWVLDRLLAIAIAIAGGEVCDLYI